ncbi:transposase [Rhizobium mongolense]|uniref:Transposase n=1 Tax=Rhizobium mongolense TaxID=57676 RepID=A0ABR6IZC6_9HYPH|nr:transposase [Rhizobium mongolense]
MTVKTDRKDARGIAQLLRMGWYRPVHAKSSPAQDTRALLVGRKLLQSKLLDVELSIRGILRGYGLKVGEVSRGRFEVRIRELIAGHPTLSMVIDAMLTARTTLIQLAWLWLRHQPATNLARWFHERVARNGGRLRKSMIVALARKLLVALWKYATAGVIIEGAAMKPA